MEKLGGKFYKDGVEMELLSILETYGVNFVRLRLWNDPYSEDGKPYGAGGNDFDTTLVLAKRALAKKMGFLLDFHYSDFWTDPGKQFVPKAWRGMDVDEFMKRGEEFQIIGMSYYPFWHGTLTDLENNMNDVAKRYGKDIIIAEVSMGFTMEDFKDYENLSDEQRKGMATKPALAEKVEYPMTPEGQSDFMKDLMTRITNVPDGKGKGFFYWEPGWIPVEGSGWATEESLEYIQDKGPAVMSGRIRLCLITMAMR